jgi:NADH-quinone oxidoreductase subunit C
MGNLSDNVTVKVLKEKHPEAVLAVEENRGYLVITARRENIHKVCRTLKESPETDYNLLLDLCGVDYLTYGQGRRGSVAATIEWPGLETPKLERKERYDVVYHLYSFPKMQRVRLKVRVPEEDPVVDSVVPVWKGANWFEREAYDLFGITFKGHPDLRRILCHQDFKGHALRKDYDPTRRHILAHPYDAFRPEDIERFKKEGIEVSKEEKSTS